MSSRGSGGSRYPSAYGHTPSYRSYNAGSTGLVGSGYPSALGTSSSSTADRLLKDFDTSLDSSLSSSRAFDKYDLGMPSTTGSNSSSSKKVASSSYSYSSTSDGGRPVVESSSDYTMRSTNTGASGIPHTSYATSSSSYSSDNPYKNRHHNFSYNI